MTVTARLLIVEDEEQVLRMLDGALVAAGYETTLARDGEAALAALSKGAFDAILLDLGLPDIDGKQIIARARAHTRTPILVVSARASENEKIAALDLGANDYLAKPFSVGELLARIRVAVRPVFGSGAAGNFNRAGVEIDFRGRMVVVEGQTKRLTANEAALLHVLVDANGAIVSHREIVDAVWGKDAELDAMHVRVLIWQLRRKMEPDPAVPKYLISEPGLGYRFNIPDEAGARS